MRQTKPLSERIWAMTDVRGDTECWPWQGYLDKDGYGQIAVGGGRGAGVLRAHRAMYQMVVGAIPEGLVVHHKCENTCCVNPAHLEPTTNRRNILLGRGAAAANAVKTHCINGHPFTPENTYRYGPRRMCRACVFARTARYRKERREAV